MDPSRDNPLFRFKAFWWGLGLFLLFTGALVIVGLANRKPSPTLEDAAAVSRLQKRATADATQAEKLKVAPSAQFAETGKRLLGKKPVAVEKPEHVVPGSPTQMKMAAEPAVPVKVVETDPAASIDPKVMEMGKTQFVICSACHGPNGTGMPNLAPPLAGSEWVRGPIENLIRIQLRGLQGPITVQGQTYSFAAPMAPLPYQTDEQIAAVLTYVRNSFGNKASAVTPEQVKAFRGEVGKPALTVADLVPPQK